MTLFKVITLVRIQFPAGDELAARADQYHLAVAPIGVERYRLASIGSLYLDGVRLIHKIFEGLFKLFSTLRGIASADPKVSCMLAMFPLQLPVCPGDAVGQPRIANHLHCIGTACIAAQPVWRGLDLLPTLALRLHGGDQSRLLWIRVSNAARG